MQKVKITQYKVQQRDGKDPEITITRRQFPPIRQAKKVVVFRCATLDKPTTLE